MRYICISFTLKGQDWEKIAAVLDSIALEYEGKDVVLIHGFLPRHILRERGIPETVLDKLQNLFYYQINCVNPHNGEVNRMTMANLADKLNARVYVVGEIQEGVSAEVDEYQRLGLQIIHRPLPAGVQA